MSKEPAEIFERAAEDGFVGQVKPFLSCSTKLVAYINQMPVKASLNRFTIWPTQWGLGIGRSCLPRSFQGHP